MTDEQLKTFGQICRNAALVDAAKICQDWIDDHSKADNCTYNDCDMVAAVTDVMNQIKELK